MNFSSMSIYPFSTPELILPSLFRSGHFIFRFKTNLIVNCTMDLHYWFSTYLFVDVSAKVLMGL